MKILFLTATLNWVGASISVLNLLKGLRRRGVDCFVVTSSDYCIDKKMTDAFEKIGVQWTSIHFYWDTSNPKTITGIKSLAYAALHPFRMQKAKKARQEAKRARNTAKEKLEEIIRDYHPDIVHTTVGEIGIGYEVCQKLGVKHVWHLREYQDKDFGWHIYPTKEKFCERLRKSDAVITITDGIRSYFNLADCPHAVTIYNGIYNHDDVCLDFPKEKYFLSASRIVEAKGIMDVVKAFSLFHQSYPDYKLLLAGMGDEAYINAIKASAEYLSCSDNIEFLGHRSDVGSLMQKATALMVGSYNEGFGRMTAEAMFRGCIAIGRNTAGTKEIINQTDGFLFDNVEEMADEMKRVADMTQEEYRKVATHAQALAANLFSNENYVQSVMKVYQKVLGA